MRRTICLFLVPMILGSAANAEIKLKPSKIESSLAQEDVQQKSAQGFTAVKETKGSEMKKPMKALFMSLILPGAGEYYTGARLKSKIFFFAEAGFWSALISYRHLGRWHQDDYKLMAVKLAGADVTGKDDRYFDLLGFYDSREQYNKVGGVYDRTRTYYPDTRFYFWKWESEDARLQYKLLKNDSRSYFRKANFSLGLIIANHVISAADAFISARRFNRGKESGFSGIEFKWLGDGGWQFATGMRF